MSISVYHNPRCSKSRAVVNLLKENNIEFNEILYLSTPPSPDALKEILTALGITARDLIRKSEQEYKDLALNNDALSEQALIQAMSDHPRLIERPIVVTDSGAAIGRPIERVKDLLSL